MKQSVHGRKVEGDMGRYLASLYSGQHPDKKYTYTDSYKNDLTLLSHFSTPLKAIQAKNKYIKQQVA